MSKSELLGALFVWKDHREWIPLVSQWLEPRLRLAHFAKVVAGGPRANPSDDSEWLDLLGSVATEDEEAMVTLLGDDLSSASIRAYHGCRVEDAGEFYRNGLLLNDPSALAAQVRRLVADEDRLSHLRPRIEQMIAQFDSTDRDTGAVHVVVDDRGQLSDSGAGHYCLYGSEWVQVLLGWGAHETLRSRGVPTIVEVDLPLGLVSEHARWELAERLLQEWTYTMVNKPDEASELDFTFTLRQPLPANCVVGHFHPAKLFDPFHRVWRRTERWVCPSCAE